MGETGNEADDDDEDSDSDDDDEQSEEVEKEREKCKHEEEIKKKVSQELSDCVIICQASKFKEFRNKSNCKTAYIYITRLIYHRQNNISWQKL